MAPALKTARFTPNHSFEPKTLPNFLPLPTFPLVGNPQHLIFYVSFVPHQLLDHVKTIHLSHSPFIRKWWLWWQWCSWCRADDNNDKIGDNDPSCTQHFKLPYYSWFRPYHTTTILLPYYHTIYPSEPAIFPSALSLYLSPPVFTPSFYYIYIIMNIE